MTINPLYTNDQLPTTSAAALREFNERLLACIAMSQPDGWHEQLGLVDSTNALHTTFPISALGLKFQKTMGENRFKTAMEAALEMKAEEFDEGIEASVIELFTQTFRWKQWKNGPAQLLIAEKNFVALNVAELLEGGTTVNRYDGVPFWSAAHPCNFAKPAEFGTFSNYQANAKAITIVNLEAEISLMKTVKDENGKKLGIKPDTLIVPSEKYESTKNLLSQTLILDTNAGVSNPYQGKLNVVEAKELTDVNDWYLVDSAMVRMGVAPWIAMKFNAPASLQFRNYDESSEFFRDHGKIKVSNHIWYSFAQGLPHAIRKIVGA